MKEKIPNWTVSRTDKERWDIQVIPIIVSFSILVILCKYPNGKFIEFIKYIIHKYIKNIHVKPVTDTLLSLQFTISIISISLMTFMAESVKERILGVSYKRIFLKKFIFYPNYITIVILILESNFFSLFCFVTDRSVIFLIVFVYTYLLIIYLLYLTYIMYSKKSRVYKKIINIFKGNFPWYKLFKRDEILKIFLSKGEEYTTQLEEKREKNIHNSYLAEEIYLLYCFKKYMEERKNEVDEKKKNGLISEKDYKKFASKDYNTTIYNEVKAVLQADCRTNEEKRLVFTENNKVYCLCQKNKFLTNSSEEINLEGIWDEITEHKSSQNQENSYKTYIVTVKSSHHN